MRESSPVRFDEREEETGLRQTGLRRQGESPANRHREATITAPLLDSTVKSGFYDRYQFVLISRHSSLVANQFAPYDLERSNYAPHPAAGALVDRFPRFSASYRIGPNFGF